MLKRSMVLMMLAALFLAPAVLEAADGDDLVGRWEWTRLESVDGEIIDVPEGSMVVEFFNDGSFKLYTGGEEDDSGTYSVEGDQFTGTTDSDGETDTLTYVVDGDTLTLTNEASTGPVRKMVLTRIGE